MDLDEEIDYTGLPYYLQVMDDLEGHGWECDERHTHATFHHEQHPGIEVHVLRSNEHPIWSVYRRGFQRHSGSSVSELQNVLSQYPSEEVLFGDEG